jgi:hypothetical protein
MNLRVTLNVLEACVAKTKTNLNQMIEDMAPGGHYRVVFSIDRPPLLAVGRSEQLLICVRIDRASMTG